MDQHCCHQWLILSTRMCNMHILYLIKTAYRKKKSSVHKTHSRRYTNLNDDEYMSGTFIQTENNKKTNLK